jgi:two-component system response regulator YesN
VKLDIQIPGFSVNDLFQPDYLLKFNDLAELKQDLVSLLRQFLGLSHMEEGTLINRIRQYMQEHYAENLSLSKIAQEHYLNPSYLSQLFKSKTGENISRFLEDIRVEKARELLSSLSV